MAELVSVVIVNWNTRDLLRACLASLPSTAGGLGVEAVVVDNGSHDGSADMVAAEFPAARLLRNERNVGFVRANNQGLRAATGRYLFMLNSDAELTEGVIERLVAEVDEPGVGAVGPRLTYPDGSPQPSFGPFPVLADRCRPGRREARYQATMAARLAAGERSVAVDWLLGTAVLTTRAVVNRVGLLDERFFMWYDDLDWAARLRRAGLESRFVPDVVVVHHGRQSAALLDQPVLSEQLLESEYLYLRLHHGRATTLAAMGLRLGKALARWATSRDGERRAESARRLRFHRRLGYRLCLAGLPPPCTAPLDEGGARA